MNYLEFSEKSNDEIFKKLNTSEKRSFKFRG